MTKSKARREKRRWSGRYLLAWIFSIVLITSFTACGNSDGMNDAKQGHTDNSGGGGSDDPVK